MDKVFLVVRPSFPSSSFVDVEAVFMNEKSALRFAEVLNRSYGYDVFLVIEKPFV